MEEELKCPGHTSVAQHVFLRIRGVFLSITDCPLRPI